MRFGIYFFYNEKQRQLAKRNDVIAQNAQVYRGKKVSWWKARRAEHRALWNWLRVHPHRGKDGWPGWDFNGGRIRSNITLCRPCYVAKSMSTVPYTDCRLCPVTWNKEGMSCEDSDSPYSLWDSSATPLGKRIYARKVRDIPWHFEGELW